MGMLERQREHKELRDKLKHHLTDLSEGEIFEAGKSSIMYVRDLGYLVLKEHEKTKNNKYFEKVRDIPEFGYYWLKEDPEDALGLIPLESLREAVEDYAI
tara:strand:+ start:313 stop:612 length:300 start_codon:yes stop_codon:yes gene_type:complete